jgi:hypothetical protein
VAALGALAYEQDGFGPTLEDVRKGLIGKIGENMSFRRFKRLKAGGGKLASYLHGTRIGVVVEFDRRRNRCQGRGHARGRHEARGADQRRRAADLIEKERSVAAAKAAEDSAGKPPASRQSPEIVAKRIEGSVQKYLKEVSLLNQPFVKNDKQTVEQMLKEKANTTVRLHAVRGGRRHREEGGRLRRRSGGPGRRCQGSCLTHRAAPAARRPTYTHSPTPGAHSCRHASPQAHPAQAVRRGPDGRRRLRHQPRHHRAHGARSCRSHPHGGARWRW